MKFKKLSSLFLAMTIASSAVLTGCSSSSEKGESGVKGSNSTELIWYMIGTPQQDQAKVMEEVNKYTSEKIGVTIDLRMIDWGDYGQKMQVVTSSGEPFDICFGTDYSLNAEKGSYLKLNDLLDSHGKDMKEAINPLFMEGASINGELYGIPANKEVAQQMVWVFNERMAKEAGVFEEMQTVKTLEELEPVLDTVVAKFPKLEMPIITGANTVPYMPYDFILGDAMPFGISLDGDTSKIVNIYEQEDIKNTLHTLRRFQEKGFIYKEAATDAKSTDMRVENWFVRKEQYAPGAGEQWTENAGYKLAYTEIHEPLTTNVSVTGSIMSVSASSKNPEKAVEFLNLLNTDEYLRNLLDRGIEDVHYTTNDDGTITKTKDSERFSLPSWAVGNVFITKNYDTDAKDRIEQYKEFNDKAVASPALGFYVDYSALKNEVAAISSIVQEYKPLLFTGTVQDVNKTLDELNQKLDKAGIDKVISTMQSQYDTWRAEQQ
ncbi:MAG: ABC transporter substrate-binding protein [Romboutsia sp.]|uniref:ABC transporter substrate-binding protein n=1 Tax=Romboutsia sp. TaxID=1965302 RepID=UPI003F3E1400